MSRTISYRGTIAMGQEDRISLATIQGKVGYKISRFEILPTVPGGSGVTVEHIAKITKVRDPNIGPTVNFTDADLLGVVYYQDHENAGYAYNDIIFDNEKFNQDIFINITDAAGGTSPCNYYIELETMDLSEVEATMLTLKSLRTITSR